jgi:hypothetical protein
MKKFFLTLFACLFCGSLVFAERTFFIAGKIEIPAEVNYNSVIVEVSGSEDLQVKPDKRGNYIIEGLSAGGNYTLTVMTSGYESVPKVRTIDELSKNIMYEDFTLKKIPAPKHNFKVESKNETGYEDDIDDIDMIDVSTNKVKKSKVNKKQPKKTADKKSAASTKNNKGKKEPVNASAKNKSIAKGSVNEGANKKTATSRKASVKAPIKEEDLFDEQELEDADTDLLSDDNDILSEQDVFESAPKKNL